MLGMEEPAVALKLAVVAPEPTVTETGTVSRALLLPSVTLVPPTGAATLIVTVQVPTALWPRLPGMQTRPETRPGTDRAMAEVWELAPREAVTVAL